MARFDALLEVRDAVTKALEDARNAKTVNKSQEAALTIVAPERAYEALAAPPMKTSKSSSSWPRWPSSAARARKSK